MHVLDLFSGIGGFALGLESVGMRTVAFCECEPYAVAVLRKHWPDTPVYPDVRRLDAASLRRDGIPSPDLICGGFPCQPFSVAGERRGTADERHLWPEFARLVGECRPAWVVAENVPGIRSLAADGVLADLEGLGYACWPVVVGALHAGAPHRRQRVWFVGHSADNTRVSFEARIPAYRSTTPGAWQLACSEDAAGDAAVADALRARPQGAGHVDRETRDTAARQSLFGREGLRRQWRAEPDVGRVAHGVSARVDRLRTLGNAVVPQVVAMIGAWIMQQHQAEAV